MLMGLLSAELTKMMEWYGLLGFRAVRLMFDFRPRATLITYWRGRELGTPITGDKRVTKAVVSCQLSLELVHCVLAL
jgi:hypothetical protein